MTTQPGPADRCTELTCPAHGETNRLLAENAEFRERLAEAERQVRELREGIEKMTRWAIPPGYANDYGMPPEAASEVWMVRSDELTALLSRAALSGVSGPPEPLEEVEPAPPYTCRCCRPTTEGASE